MESRTGLTTRFDEFFNTWRQNIPLEFLRVLSWRESSHKEHNREGAAWGLLEIVPVVLADFNKRYKTTYTMDDVADNVSLNVRMACETLHTVIKVYNASGLKELKENWMDENWIILLTMGWNSGYSVQGGLTKVALYLHKEGIAINPESIRTNAKAAGGSRWLTERKTTWARSVADLYYKERWANGVVPC